MVFFPSGLLLYPSSLFGDPKRSTKSEDSKVIVGYIKVGNDMTYLIFSIMFELKMFDCCGLCYLLKYMSQMTGVSL